MRLLFVVHGMGTNTKDWSKPLVAQLDKLAGQYAAFKTGPAFSKRVKIAEITYDKVFSDIVQSWQDAGADLKNLLKDNKARLPLIQQKIADATLPQNTTNVFWSTLIDPILYRAVSDVRRQVRASVIEQVMAALNANGGGQAAEPSVLCHSLGTIVMHDALAVLGSQPQGGNDVFTSARFRFENLFSLANVSRLGPNEPDLEPYDTCVRPITAPNTAAGVKPYVGRMFTFRHRWDPFTFIERFEPPANWGENYQGGPESTLFHFRSANVHGLAHYLDHPAVHVPVLNRSLGKPEITQKELSDALAKYPQFPPQCSNAVLKLKNRLEELEHALEEASDWKALDSTLVTGMAFYEAARAAEEACHDMAETLLGG